MLVCDVSAIDRLIDMYGENLSVFYNDKQYNLYNLREKFVDENTECSLDNFITSSLGIRKKDDQDTIFVSIDSHQGYDRDDIIL
jgi:hypothetical protein